MTGLGLCVSPRHLPSKDELKVLQPASLASVVYSIDTIGTLLEMAGDKPVVVSLNNECVEVGGDWRGFKLACETIAKRYAGRNLIICAGHELDLFWADDPTDCPPEFGASLVLTAVNAFRGTSIKVSVSPVAGPAWMTWLGQVMKLLGDRAVYPDAIAADFYGQAPDGWHRPIFGMLRYCIDTARNIAGGLPIILREYGIKVSDAGSEEAQSDFLDLTAQMLKTYGPDEVIAASWFGYHEMMGKPDERGSSSFGLVRADGTMTPAYQVFAAFPKVEAEAPEPTTKSTLDMTFDERVELICQKADEHGIDRVEFLGGAFAESGSNLDQLERKTVWPDWSVGLFHEGVSWSEIGDKSQTEENYRLTLKILSDDPARACDIAARKYKYWRHDPDVSPIQAWCGYNGSKAGYHGWASWANRKNYEQGLARAARLLSGGTAPIFDPNYPAIAQNQSFDCSETALLWILRAFGRGPTDAWLEGAMLTGTPNVEPIMRSDDGLLDHTGAGITRLVNAEYGEFGYVARDTHYVPFDMVVSAAGGHIIGFSEGYASRGVMIGGQAFNHWVSVRGYDRVNNLLLLMNPADSYTINDIRVGQTMNREQFERLGKFSMVEIGWKGFPEAKQPEPEPAPADAEDDQVAKLAARVEQLESLLGVLGDNDGSVIPALQDVMSQAGQLHTNLTAIRDFIRTNKP